MGVKIDEHTPSHSPIFKLDTKQTDYRYLLLDKLSSPM